ncbi:MAG: nuclease-related domain-containing protein [Candidatus Bathyarchaeia archaeon]
MVEVNEEMVRKWLEEVKGFFVVTDVKYRVPRGWGDIDIIAYNPITGDAWVVEVKGWHTEVVYPSYSKYIKPLHANSLAVIQQKLGNRKFERVLVVPKLSNIQKTKNATYHAFAQKGINQLIEFPQILKDLINSINTHKAYDSEILQTLRVLKVYRFI